MIEKNIGNKKVLWLPEFNKYILVEPPVDKVFDWLHKGKSEKEVIEKIKKENINEELLIESVKSIQQVLAGFKKVKRESQSIQKHIPEKPKRFEIERFYRVGSTTFKFNFENKHTEYLIHPKFAHLELKKTKNFQINFEVFEYKSRLNLFVNDRFINSWNKSEEHYFTGKVSMEMLQIIHKKKERDWMATFHAAGISDGENGIMLFGESGSGKSTLSSILMANGYKVLADDFLPLDADTIKMHYFPAAISIKKGAYDVVSDIFPEIKNAKEYIYPQMGKKVRYLSGISNAFNPPQSVTCKALVFVSYKKNSGLIFIPLQKEVAFQKLIPDSWISPLEENARKFLNWFLELPSYKLTYSDNQAMINAVKRLFNE